MPFKSWVSWLCLLFVIILCALWFFSLRLSAVISFLSLMACQYGHASPNFLLLICSRLESQIGTLFRTESKKRVKSFCEGFVHYNKLWNRTCPNTSELIESGKMMLWLVSYKIKRPLVCERDFSVKSLKIKGIILRNLQIEIILMFTWSRLFAKWHVRFLSVLSLRLEAH